MNNYDEQFIEMNEAILNNYEELKREAIEGYQEYEQLGRDC